MNNNNSSCVQIRNVSSTYLNPSYSHYGKDTFYLPDSMTKPSWNRINPIPTRLCQVIYCHGDKSYPCLVGIGLTLVLYFLKKK